jgi:hypothetical protein
MISKNLVFGLYPSSNVFSLKTTFQKLALLPSSGKKERGEGMAPTLWGPLERVSLDHWTTLSPLFYLKTEAKPASETLFFLKKKTFDDGYRTKTRFFEMHHTIVKTLQNCVMIVY